MLYNVNRSIFHIIIPDSSVVLVHSPIGSGVQLVLLMHTDMNSSAWSGILSVHQNETVAPSNVELYIPLRLVLLPTGGKGTPQSTASA